MPTDEWEARRKGRNRRSRVGKVFELVMAFPGNQQLKKKIRRWREMHGVPKTFKRQYAQWLSLHKRAHQGATREEAVKRKHALFKEWETRAKAKRWQNPEWRATYRRKMARRKWREYEEKHKRTGWQPPRPPEKEPEGGYTHEQAAAKLYWAQRARAAKEKPYVSPAARRKRRRT